MRRLLLVSTSWAAIVAGGAAAAQDIGVPAESADAPASASSPASDRVDSGSEPLFEIVVTAQRRSESLQEVPVSVTALTADTLLTRNLNDLSQVALAAPSLQIGLLGNFSIRGVGTLALANTVDSSVATAVDEVNLGRPNFAINLFSDVQRVEVLNGPQGLLFGRNASAGLLNVITNMPVLRKLQNISSFEVATLPRPGTDDDATSIIVRETINLPLTDTSALRLNGFYSDAQSPVSIVSNSSVRQDSALQQYGMRAKYLNEFTDRLSLYVIGEYAESQGGGAANNTYRAVGTGASLIAPRLNADGIVAGPENFLLSGAAGFFKDLKTSGAQATLSYDLGNGLELSNISAWKHVNSDAQFDTDLVSADGLDVNRTQLRYDQFSNELRLALPTDGRLSGQAGLYYFEAHTDNETATGGGLFIPVASQPLFPFCVGPASTPGCTTRNVRIVGRDFAYRLKNRSYAAFGQLTYDVTDDLKAIAGARVTRDELSIDQTQNQGNYFRPLSVRASFDQGETNTNFSWKGGLQYQVNDDVMAYATYGRGYKGPGTNDVGATPTSDLIVKAETSDNLEVGIRSTLFERLIVNVSAFHTKFENYQSQSFNAAVTAFIIQNAAAVTSQGAEITVLASPFKGLSLNASGAFVDAEFDSFLGAQCYPGQPTPGCATAGSFDASGFRTPTTPSFTSSMQAIYERTVGDGINAFVETNYYHRSPINYQINRGPGSQVPTINILGGSLGIGFDSGTRLSVFCKNCNNKKYPAFIASDPIDATTNVASYNQTFGPDSVRTLGIAGTYQF